MLAHSAQVGGHGHPPTDAVVTSRLDVDGFVRHLAAEGSTTRRVIGLVGPPGVGKSTLAGRLADDLGAVVAPMDGFHLRNDELDRRGLRDRKGAPETFDAAGFAAAVESVVRGDVVGWPAFDRALDEPVTDALRIAPSAPLVVIEGNYLLLDDVPWRSIPPMLDEVAFLVLDPEVRVERLIARHVAHGRSRRDATEFVLRADERNAALIETTRGRATILVDVD